MELIRSKAALVSWAVPNQCNQPIPSGAASHRLCRSARAFLVRIRMDSGFSRSRNRRALSLNRDTGRRFASGSTFASNAAWSSSGRVRI